MRIYPDFPPHRRQDPRCRSEAIIYDQLSQCELPGHGLYELNPGPETVEVDFALWIEDQARIGLQVKEGITRSRTPCGASACPPAPTWCPAP